jgi:GT2 family glycosyltransferase
VSDSGSSDNTIGYLSKLKEKYPDIVNWRHTEENSGWTKGINWGISQGHSEFVLIANCDIVLPYQWFEKMSAHFTDGVGAIGPISDFASGRQNLNYSYKQQEDNVELLIGFCILTKREILDKVGGFDEDYIYDHDDYDFSYRIRKAGYRLVIARDVFVKHFGCNSKSGFYAENKLVEKGRELFISKHGNDAYNKTAIIKPTVVIAIPFFGDVDVEFLSSLTSLDKPGGRGAIVYAKTIRTLIIPARNLLAQSALDYDSQFLLFIDSDMVFGSESLMRLLTRAADKNVSIVGAISYKRKTPYEACIVRRIGSKWRYCDSSGPPGMYEVDGIGMAFTLIKTQVFKDLEKPYFYANRSGLREDLNFCWNAKKAGHRIFVDTSVQVGHLGERIVIDHQLKFLNEKIKQGTLVI